MTHDDPEGGRKLAASIIVLTKNGEEYLLSLLDGLFQQTCIDSAEVIVIDSGSSDRTLEIIKLFPKIRLFTIPAAEFGHGKTRNLGARLAHGEFLVYVPQDATPVGALWLASLLAPFESPLIAGVYGRQIPRENSSTMEQHFLQSTYHTCPGDRFLAHGEQATLSRCFFSTVSGAIRASVWKNHPFREDVIMSEDQAWARDIMLQRLGICYEPNACVLHSHQYGIVDIFRRNFDSGYSVFQIFGSETGIPISSVVLSLISETKFVFGAAKWKEIAVFPIYEIARHFGFWLGLHGSRLPRRVARACSHLTYFWNAPVSIRDK